MNADILWIEVVASEFHENLKLVTKIRLVWQAVFFSRYIVNIFVGMVFSRLLFLSFPGPRHRCRFHPAAPSDRRSGF